MTRASGCRVGKCPTCRPPWPRRVCDYLKATDPTFGRLRAGWRMLVSLPAGMAAGHGMAVALGQPGLLGLMFGGTLGMLVGLTISDPKPLWLAVRCVWGLPAFLAAMLLASALHPYRILALCVLAVMLGLHVAGRGHLGDFGHDMGLFLFAGYLGGLLAPLPVSAFEYLGPICVAAALGVAAVQVLLCRPRPRHFLAHVERGFLARTRYVVRGAERLIVTGHRNTRAASRLSNQMLSLNEAAMLVDGYLSQPACTLPAGRAEDLHRLVFDTELAVQALGHAVLELCRGPLPDEARTLLAAALADVRHDGCHHDVPASVTPLLEWLARHEKRCPIPADEPLVSLLYQFVAALSDLHRACEAWTSGSEPDAAPEADGIGPRDGRCAFTTPISLVAGDLSGTTLLSHRTHASGGRHRTRRAWRPNASLRSAIQVTAALVVAVPVGDAVSGDRSYWAAIGALIILTGTNSVHERMRKLAKRIVGTVIGGLLGIGFVDLLGTAHPEATVILVCVALSIGAYSISTYYTIWVIGLVVSLFQLYAYIGEFHDSLAVIRLAENVIGAVAATAVALVILPLAAVTLLRRAQSDHLRSLATLVRECGRAWTGPAGAAGTREHARAVDQAAHELHRVSQSFVRLPGSVHGARAEDVRITLRRAAYYAREIAGSGGWSLTSWQRAHLLDITSNLARSIDVLAETVSGNLTASTAVPDRPWIRSADRIWRMDRKLTPCTANAELRRTLHYLGDLDDLLAGLAARLSVNVHGTDFRTGTAAHRHELLILRAEQSLAVAPTSPNENRVRL